MGGSLAVLGSTTILYGLKKVTDQAKDLSCSPVLQRFAARQGGVPFRRTPVIAQPARAGQPAMHRP
jgi:hypothetical protein